MSTKATVSLVLVLAVLCGAYWLVGRAEDASFQQVVSAKRLFDFEAGDVVTVSLTRLGAGPVDGVRGDEGGWSIAAPYPHILANGVVWERVAVAVAGLSNERTLDEEPPDLAAYGLAEPMLKVVVGSGQGPLVEVVFGGLDPTEMFRYTVVGDGPVVLTPMEAFRELDRPLADLRDRHLFDLGEEGITRIEFARYWTADEDANGKKQGPDRYTPEAGDESVAVVFGKTAEGVWRMSEPVDAAVDQESVKAFETELQFAMGRGYVDAVDSLSDYGLDFPGARVSVFSGKGSKRQTITLGWIAEGEDGGLFVKRKAHPSVFVIDAHLLTLIPDSPYAFRDRQLFSGEAKGIRRIDYIRRVEEGDAGDGVAREGFSLALDAAAGWRLVAPPADDTDQRAVSRFLSLLKNTRSVKFPAERDGAVLGFDDPLISIALSGDAVSSDAVSPGPILVGGLVAGTDPPLRYARRQDGVVVTLSASSVANLQWERSSFRQKRLLSFLGRDAGELSLEVDGTGYVMKRVEGRWVVVEPLDRTLESQSDVAGLLEALERASATGMADSRPGGAVDGLDAPVLTVTVGFLAGPDGAGGGVLGPLKVGHVAPDEGRNRFATVAGRSGVFFVDQALLDDVREALRGVVPR